MAEGDRRKHKLVGHQADKKESLATLASACHCRCLSRLMSVYLRETEAPMRAAYRPTPQDFMRYGIHFKKLTQRCHTVTQRIHARASDSGLLKMGGMPFRSLFLLGLR